MKRSEMTMLMYAWMLEPPKNISQIHDGGQQMYKMMEFILGKMEEAGMLPPSRPATPNDIINITQEFIDEHGFTENSWDEEL